MKRKLQLEETIAPNLVPMVDIMFLLLLFLMLSADMGQRELEEVLLPKAENVKKDVVKDAQKDRLVVNVFHEPKQICAAYDSQNVCRDDKHWHIGVKGADLTPMPVLRQKIEEEAKPFRTDVAHPKISTRRVMIRADANGPFGLVQETMNECAAAGIFQVEVGAADPPKESPRRH